MPTPVGPGLGAGGQGGWVGAGADQRIFLWLGWVCVATDGPACREEQGGTSRHQGGPKDGAGEWTEGIFPSPTLANKVGQVTGSSHSPPHHWVSQFPAAAI
jgi:hypothetical protein